MKKSLLVAVCLMLLSANVFAAKKQRNMPPAAEEVRSAVVSSELNTIKVGTKEFRLNDAYVRAPKHLPGKMYTLQYVQNKGKETIRITFFEDMDEVSPIGTKANANKGSLGYMTLGAFDDDFGAGQETLFASSSQGGSTNIFAIRSILFKEGMMEIMYMTDRAVDMFKNEKEGFAKAISKVLRVPVFEPQKVMQLAEEMDAQ